MTQLAQRLAILFALPAAALAAEPEGHSARMKAGTALFKETIRPALESRCLKCHGGEKVRAGFSVGSRKSFLKGGDSGPALDLEHASASRLLEQLRHEEEPHMPPKGGKLDASLVNAFERWINLGAPFDKPLVEGDDGSKREFAVTDSDRQFWSFRPLAKVKVPKEEGKTLIDRFVLAKLKGQGVKPNGPAKPGAFVRRAYLDLTGLPPTPSQMKKALAQSREALIDELLSSPHYGERWARHWLDAARFAESHGFEQDYDRKHAYHFRDFVIKALNADMPFDQFVRWQLAGDEIAPDNPLALMATGFIGAGAFPTQLTEKEFESARYDELDDIVSTLGTSMLGLTLGCARCHDHKYDPVSMKDYYQLAAVFTTTIRSEIDVNLDPEGFAKAKVDWKRKHASLVAPREDYEKRPEFQTAFDGWLSTAAESLQKEAPWAVLDISNAESSRKTVLAPQGDGSLLATGKAPDRETYTLRATTAATGVKWFRMEALTDKSLPRQGPGRAGNGNFALSNLKVFVKPASQKDGKRRQIKIVSAKATHEQNRGNLSVASAFDANPTGTGWAVDKGGIGKDQAAVFELAEPVGFEGGAEFEFQLTFANNTRHSIGRPRLSISSDAAPPVAVGGGMSEKLSVALAAVESGELTKEHRQTLIPYFGKTDPDWRKLDKAVRASLKSQPQPQMSKVQVSSEGLKPTKHHADGRGFPHFYPMTYFLNRGDPSQKKGEASAGYLQVLMRKGSKTEEWLQSRPEGWRTSFRRYSLANWITDTGNGAGNLLARVIVNRLWHHHFGRGIVATPNDFGLQGAEPSHPELLEHLAGQLIANGWKLKPIHRQIMLSAAYGRGGAPSTGNVAIDPDNRWLWRFAPRRLEAENIRDAMLAVSGRLDTTPFGPGTLDPNHRRRSIYFMIKRSRLVSMMQIFDQPEPLVSQGRRPSTTIAPQALMFMNGKQVVDQAAAFAARFARDDLETAVHGIYNHALARDPSPAELVDSRAFIESQTAAYESAEAGQLALADFCQVVFGLNEFIYLQ